MFKKIIIGLVVILLIGSSLSMTASALNNPPNVPSNPHPDDGAIDIGVKTHLSWTACDPDPGDKAIYDLYFGTEPNPDLIASDLEKPNYYPGILEHNTQYFWKVVAKDEQGASTTGPEWTFTTNDCDCDPPDKPSGPTRTRNRHRYEYTTKIMNQNQDGLYYNFSWGDGNCSGWLGPYNHNERVRAEYQWEEPGNYQVQARARFQNGAKTMNGWTITGWSEPLLVSVTNDDPQNEPPTIPAIDGTINGKVGVEYEYAFSADDPEGDDIYYYIEFCEGCTEAKWHGPYPSGYQLTITHKWEQEGTFDIRAKTKDIYEEESDWATLQVTMPKNKIQNFPVITNILEKIFNNFPRLEQLLMQFLS